MATRWSAISLPTTPAELYRFGFFAAAAYIVLAYGVRLLYYARAPHQLRARAKFTFDLSMNSFTFATSVLLVLAVVFPPVLKLLGDMQPFLMSTAIVGLLYTANGLFEA